MVEPNTLEVSTISGPPFTVFILANKTRYVLHILSSPEFSVGYLCYSHMYLTSDVKHYVFIYLV